MQYANLSGTFAPIRHPSDTEPPQGESSPRSLSWNVMYLHPLDLISERKVSSFMLRESPPEYWLNLYTEHHGTTDPFPRLHYCCHGHRSQKVWEAHRADESTLPWIRQDRHNLLVNLPYSNLLVLERERVTEFSSAPCPKATGYQRCLPWVDSILRSVTPPRNP